jgi:recombination protein RecA
MGRPPKSKSAEEDVKVSAGAAVKDDLALLIQKNLTKALEESAFIGFLDEPEEAPTTVTDWISTGNSLLDLAISNKPNGGLPVGKMVELTGLESSGKSLLAAHVLAETQKRGGISVYIDTESAVSPEFLNAIGVDTGNMLYMQLETIEDIFQAMENIITSVRNSSKDRLVTIVVDSLAGASTKVEMEANYDKDGYATTKAILLSKALRKITNLIAQQKILVLFTNQLRQKMQAMAFADPYTTSGGKAVGYHCSVRIRLSSVGKIKKGEEVAGNKVKAQVIKNRVGPPFRSAEFEIYYDSGIDNLGSWITTLKDYSIIKQSGSSYSFEMPTGEEVKFMAREFKDLVETKPEIKEYLYGCLCKQLIMEYKKPGEVRVGEDLKVDSKDMVGEDE